ncbi:MAG TPA: ice-binding family protein [Candidatus Saccharimonadia bacterium]|nr:ice-binding family protein [Candidatus Saccharimonadia bacterium]
MKTFLAALLLAYFTQFSAHAAILGAPFIPEEDARFDALERAGIASVPGAPQVGTSAQPIARVVYNAATMGGSTTTPFYLGVTLPANSLITRDYFNVSTAFAPSGAGSVSSQADALAAYNSFAALPGVPISATLDSQVLTPGVYSSGACALAGSGAASLTFSGAGRYVINCSSTLVTGSGGTPTINLVNGATANNIFWVLGTAATLNSGHTGVFYGNVLAGTAITVTSGGTINGSLINTTSGGTATTISTTGTTVVAQNSVELGGAASYAILARSAITNTGTGVFTGNVGISPGVLSSITGITAPMVSGTINDATTGNTATSSSLRIYCAASGHDLLAATNAVGLTLGSHDAGSLGPSATFVGMETSPCALTAVVSGSLTAGILQFFANFVVVK